MFMRVSTFLIILMTSSFVGLNASAQMDEELKLEVFEILDRDDSDSALNIDFAQKCLASAKVMQHAVTLDLVDADSKRATRADKTAELYEVLLVERAQTDVIFNQRVETIKSEYLEFKTADKKQRKELLKVAKVENKKCGKRVKNMTRQFATRSHDIAVLMPKVSSETAELCMAVNGKAIDTPDGYLDFIGQFYVWHSVFEIAKRREGFPDNQLVDRIKIVPSLEKLKTVDTARALELFKTCGSDFETAKFEYNLVKPDSLPEFVSRVEWDS